jgi:creatinine amidohydrolase
LKVYNLTDMTWEEVQNALETVKIAIIPIGAHEQHGRHMVESCDAVLAEKMSLKLAERLFPEALMTPTVSLGVSHHHINFPGTISLQPTTVIAILRDIIQSLQHHGINKFLILNAHGGNQATLNVASTTLSQECNSEIYFAKTTSSAKSAIKQHIESDLYGHSCEREVSEALYLAPHLVRNERLEKGDIQEGNWRFLRPGNPIQGSYKYEEMTKNGNIGDGRQASKEIGEQIVEEALSNLEKGVRNLI